MSELFCQINISNAPTTLRNSFRIEAALKKIKLRELYIQALKEHRNNNPINTDKFICPEKEKE